MIDLHCHILPCIDDGAETIAEAVEMARIAADDGVRKIVATPHISESMLDFETIKDKTGKLNQRLTELLIPIEVLPGAEISSGMPVRYLKQYSINNNGYVLIEFPHSHLPKNAEGLLSEIVREGLKPLIAHPERNPSIIKRPALLEELVGKTGAGVQVTANSIAGGFGRKIRACSHYLLKKGIVHIIASDAHSSRFRTPELSIALKTTAKLIGSENVQKLVVENPEAVVNGGELIKFCKRIGSNC